MAVKMNPSQSEVKTDGTLYAYFTADAASDLTSFVKYESFNISFGSLCLVLATGDVWGYGSSGWVNVTTSTPTKKSSK